MTDSSTKNNDVCVLNGHCYCGNVQYRINFIESTNEFSKGVYCHCESCRRANAAPLYQVAVIDASMFEITSGDDAIKEFQKEPGKLIRAFSTCCGMKLYNKAPHFKPGGKKLPFSFQTL